jgi:hypothetical protein
MRSVVDPFCAAHEEIDGLSYRAWIGVGQRPGDFAFCFDLPFSL